ncbi:MAG: 7-cyano-7-deazaguanine reductase [Pseudohongiellaceae bacterium]|jgi:7-cyano-7-deazaguanine reductase
MTAALPLGQATVYKTQYDASLLYPIPRQNTRRTLFADKDLPFTGTDLWTAYEVSWLNSQGMPQLRLVEFIFAHDTVNIVESKSFKLYLNSFNQTYLDSENDLKRIMFNDLSAAAVGMLEIFFYDLDDAHNLAIDHLPGRCIDGCDIRIEHYHREAQLLCVSQNESKAENITVERETLYSHLLKTNCPVTNQPDWATIFIEYSGPKIKAENLLAYLVSFREHQDFHENCVEQIFVDIDQQCKPTTLAVYARYTRRGGLDINPMRYSLNTVEQPFKNLRLRTRRQ